MCIVSYSIMSVVPFRSKGSKTNSLYSLEIRNAYDQGRSAKGGFQISKLD